MDRMGIRVSLTTLLLSSLALVSCSPKGAGVAPATPSAYGSHAISTKTAVATPVWAVPNKFEPARGKVLSDHDLDSYIDPGVTGADRIMAHKLMGLMPKNRRGDFLYFDGHKVLSNNIALATQAKLQRRAESRTVGGLVSAATTVAGSRRETRSYSSSCSPPDPFGGTGPYVRNVSRCGVTGGWAVVFLPCGDTYMASSGDNGFMYWEWRDAIGGLYEGGMFTHTGAADINPYLSASVHQNLQNPNARYACGNYLGMMAGLVNPAQIGGAPMVYVVIGNIPGYNPANAYSPTETVTFQNAAWLFAVAPGDVNHPGLDAAQIQTPCTVCSISRVTSIGQSSQTNDGSYFGVDANGDNSLHYLEVAYGEWQNTCSGTYCEMVHSTNPANFYGGQQNYPSANAADSKISPNGYVTEAFDGVDTGYLASSTRRQPAGPFVVPAPPDCAIDSYGYCLAATDAEQYTYNCGTIDGYGPVPELLGANSYVVKNSYSVLHSYYDYWADDNTGYCRSYETWTPGEPSQVLGDPNLP